MSLVNGYLQQMGGTAAKQMLVITTMVYPVVIGSSTLIVPDVKQVPTNETGFWQTALSKGVYRLDAIGPNSQLVASVYIEVPEDNEIYAFTELLTDDPNLSDQGLGGELELKTALNIAAMKNLPATVGLASILKAVILEAPDPGAAVLWRYKYGDTTTVEGELGPVRDAFNRGTFFPVV
jgi:hypothetical protein